MQSNVDQEEIAKFEALANDWWNPEGAFKPLHDINPLRLNYIDLRTGLRNKFVVDIGCGGGILSHAMALRGANVTGIDAGKIPIEIARLHSQHTHVPVHYLQTTAEMLAQDYLHHFDVVTCLEMLEHVPDPYSVIGACMRLLKPEGHLFLSTINKTAKSWLFAIIGAEYILKLLPKGTHNWKKFIAPHALATMCRAHALHIKNITGMTYNPLTKTYRLNQHDLNVNYLIYAVKSA